MENINVKKEKKSILFTGMKIFWVFILGCLTGFIVETAFTLLITGQFQLRQGVIYGPFAQVYGLGGVAFYLALPKIKGNIKTFFISMLLGATVEFTCSYLQEKIFGTVSWDYTGSLLNIQGRTNLMYGICWGFFGLFFIHAIFPRFEKIDLYLQKRSFKLVTAVFILFMIGNFTISSMAAYRQKERLQRITARNNIDRFLDNVYPDYVMNRVYSNKQQRSVIK